MIGSQGPSTVDYQTDHYSADHSSAERWRNCLGIIPRFRFTRFLLGLAILSFILLAAPTPADGEEEPEPLSFETLTAADGLSLSIVDDILQDHQGYMWFATSNGLNRFDGYSFTVFRPDPLDAASIASQTITALFEDDQGQLWIGTDIGLDRFDRTTGTFEHQTISGIDLPVHVIQSDREGDLLIGTDFGLKRLDPTDGTVTKIQANPGEEAALAPYKISVTDIYEDDQGQLWIGTVNGLDRLDPVTGDIVHFRHDPGDLASLADDVIMKIEEDGRGGLWIATLNGGLNSLDPATGEITRHQHDPDDPSTISSNTVFDLQMDEDDRLWVGTIDGLDVFDPQKGYFQHYSNDPTDPQSLAADVIRAVYRDRSGLLWVATVAGLNKQNVVANRFDLYRQGQYPLEGLKDDLVTAVLQDRSGIVWIATIAGGLNRLDPESGEFSIFQHDPDDPGSISPGAINVLLEDTAGTLWLSTGSGLDRFEPLSGIFSHFILPISQEVTALNEDSNGNLLVGTPYESFVFDRHDETFIPLHRQTLGGIAIRKFLTDQAGNIWIGTSDQGLWVGSPSPLRVIKGLTQFVNNPADPTSLGPGPVLAIYEDAEGVIWVGTFNGGLSRYNSGESNFTRFTEADGLNSDAVTCIQSDEEGFLWLGTSTGLSKFDPHSETFQNFGPRDGLQDGEFTSCYQGPDGQMFFGGLRGLNAFFPDQIKENYNNPPIAITALNVSDKPVRSNLLPGEHIELPYDENFISFEYAALDYTDPQSSQYAYKLEGLEEDWVNAGTRRLASYPDLRPGDYVFRVKGSNNDGIWNEEGAAVFITIRPPFWETWVFRGVFLMVLVAVVAAGYQLRVRSLRARSRELEKQVEETTHEVEERTREVAVLAERQRLARDLHDSVTQSLYSLTLMTGAAERLYESGDVDQAAKYQVRQGQIAQQALKEMRLLVYELRPSVLDEEGLVGALQHRLDAVERRVDMEALLDGEGDLDLPPDVEEELYHIAQEALNNALKHAAPSRVSIAINSKNGEIEMTIADNGRGFDPQTGIDAPGNGLDNMVQRAQQIGGALEIRSAEGKGTEIVVKVSGVYE